MSTRGDQPGEQVQPVDDLVMESRGERRHLEQERAGRVGHVVDVATVDRVGPELGRRLAAAWLPTEGAPRTDPCRASGTGPPPG